MWGVGLDVRKIAGFGDLDGEMQKELVAAFPKPVARFVQAKMFMVPSQILVLLPCAARKENALGK